MKLGVHLSTYAATWEDEGLDYIEHAAKTGFDGVEFPLAQPSNFHAKRAKELLKTYNLGCTCGTGLNPQEDISSTDAAIRDRGIKRLKKCIDICNYLETDCLGGVLYAPWGAKLPRDQAIKNYQYSVEGLKEAAGYAKEKGVTLSLELLNRYESYFVNTVEEGLTLLKTIGVDNVKLHFDTFHAHIEENNMKEAILKGKGSIHHVHLCDNNRAAPGSGSVDWIRVREGLLEIKFNRWMMIENFVRANTEAGTDVCIWSGTGKTAFEIVEEGYRFIKQLFS